MLDTLRIISAQLDGFTITNSFVNATVPSTEVPPGASFMAPTYAIWLNTLWFSALICTLSASSIAIMVRQWLHQYSTGLSGNSRDTARLRQYRYECLVKWRVAEIVSLLPVLLQLALILFLVGLLFLLWSIHPTVAIVGSALTGVLLLFTIWTTVIPAFRSDCCYQSPQALYFFLLIQSLGGSIRFAVQTVGEAAHDVAIWRSGFLRTSLWAVWNYSREILRSLGTWGTYKTWEMRERRTLHPIAADIDFCLIHATYEQTMSDGLLKTVLARCMEDLEPMAVFRGCVNYLAKITTVDDLFFVYDIERDSFVDIRFPLGHRRVRYNIHLFKHVLALLPKCVDNVGPFGYDRDEMEVLARKVLALLPPKLEGTDRYVTFHTTEPIFEYSEILRALAKLVKKGIHPTDAFLKMVNTVKVLESSNDGMHFRKLGLRDIQPGMCLPVRRTLVVY